MVFHPCPVMVVDQIFDFGSLTHTPPSCIPPSLDPTRPSILPPHTVARSTVHTRGHQPDRRCGDNGGWIHPSSPRALKRPTPTRAVQSSCAATHAARPNPLHSTPLATPCDLSLLLLPAAVRLHPHVVRRFFSHRVGASMRRARGTEGVRYG